VKRDRANDIAVTGEKVGQRQTIPTSHRPDTQKYRGVCVWSIGISFYVG